MSGFVGTQEMEEGILGAALCDEGRALAVAALTEDHFRGEDHRRLFRSIRRICDAGGHVDAITTRADLEGRDEVLGSLSLPDLSSRGVGVSEKAFGSYLIGVHTEQVRQRIAATGRLMATLAHEADKTPDELLAKAFQDLLEIGEQNREVLRRLQEILKGDVAMEIIPTQKTNESVVATGFHDLDKLTSGGMRPGELWIAAGRPGMGKSALATSLAVQVTDRGYAVALFSLEMSTLANIQRIICTVGSVDHERLRSARLDAEELKAASFALNTVAALPLWINDRADLSVEELFAQVKRLSMTEPLKLVIVDYLQLLTAKGVWRHESRQQEVTIITNTLKRLAKECRCTVLALAQLNRESERRKTKDRIPKLSDLRESGSIEQNADVVMFPFRPEMYDKENPSLYQIAYLYVAKQRSGPTGKVQLKFEGEYVRFVNCDYDQEESPF